MSGVDPQRISNAATSSIADEALPNAGWAAALEVAGTGERHTLLGLVEGRGRTRTLPAKGAAAAVRRLKTRFQDGIAAAITVGERRPTVLHPRGRPAVSREEWPGLTDRTVARHQPSPRRLRPLPGPGGRRRGADIVTEHVDAALAAAGEHTAGAYWGAVMDALCETATRGNPPGFTLRTQAACSVLSTTTEDIDTVDAVTATACVAGHFNDISVDGIHAVLGSDEYTQASLEVRATIYAAIASAAASEPLTWLDRWHPDDALGAAALHKLAQLAVASTEKYLCGAAVVFAAHITTSGGTLTDASALLSKRPAALTDVEFDAVWRAGHLTGTTPEALTELVTAATPPDTRRHVTHTTYTALLESTAGNLDVHTADRIRTAHTGMVREPEWAAAIAGHWGHRWDPGDVAAVLADDPDRSHVVYGELSRHVTPDTPQVLTDAAATHVGLLRWIELVPGHARALFTDAADLTVDEWFTLWQLLSNGFKGTGAEAIGVARTAT